MVRDTEAGLVMYDPILDCFGTLACFPRLLADVAAGYVSCACSITCIAVEQSDDTVAAVAADATFPSVPSFVLAVDGPGTAAEESGNTKDIQSLVYTKCVQKQEACDI